MKPPSFAALALNRFGLGARKAQTPPADARRWLLDQFERYQPRPAAWAAQPGATALLAEQSQQRLALRDMRAGGAGRDEEIAAARRALRRDARDDYQSAAGARVGSALESDTPFIERLVHFWANHFALSADKPVVAALAGSFEAEAIRPHVLGRFERLLLAVERHPAMLIYLDQAQSIGPDSRAAERAAQRRPQQRRGLNENLAREILELHTLGVGGGYTQADVTEFARALTGWGIAGPDDRDSGGDGFRFRPGQHEPGERLIRGRRYAASARDDGAAQGEQVLRDLAAAPATARHLATKLARHFNADEPAPALVDRLANAYLRSGGELAVVYRALVDAPESWQAAAPKFKSPWDWLISAGRGLGWRGDVSLTRPGGRGAVQPVALLQQLGQPLWRPGSPAGWGDRASDWAAPDALLRRVELAQRLAMQAGPALDARALAPQLLPGSLGESTERALARADSPAAALALLLVAPEFLRR